MHAILRVTVCLFAITGSAFAGQIDFNHDIRPILSSNCFKCHGPDDGLRQAGLRLDDRADAVAPLDSGETAIVPGKPEASELVARIESNDADAMMPPPSSNKTLTAQQKQLLRAWIAAGAEYKTHWAFVKPQRPAVPAVHDQRYRNQNAIDAFVADRLARENLAMSPEADRYTLARRVYLDLIGIPPTPEEADALANDTSPDAYEELVDWLLSSPHYGERWARRWLDLARYSDTNGYEKDRPRSMWPYRDWVIKALNADMPFDQFTIRQIAGDMLPGATLDDVVATGFHRNTMINEEGGIDPQEFRFYSNVDRVSTTGAVWLGLTLGCVQCHTHKYDPIAHKEFYQLLSFFDQADEPMVDVALANVTRRRAEVESQIAAIESTLAARPLDQAAFDRWVAEESLKAVRWTVLDPRQMSANLSSLDPLSDKSILASGDQTKLDVYELSYAPVATKITALRLEALPHESLPAGGPGRIYYEGPFGDFFLSDLKMAAGGKPVAFAGAVQTTGDAKGAVDDKTETAWSPGVGQGKPQTAIFKLAEPLDASTELQVRMTFEKYYAAGLGRFRLSVTDDARSIEKISLPVDVEAILSKPAADRTLADGARLVAHYRSIAPEFAAERTKIEEIRKQLPGYPTTLVMKQRRADRYRQTHRYHRGEFLQPKEPVEPGGIAALHPFPVGASRDRLAFARWLVDRNNPLVARVTMNRHWGTFFGRGLVRTSEDFGTQGEPPTHPELLDWLAIEFMDRGWSQKAMHRLIVTSATYRQASRMTPVLTERDPLNRLLARGPRVRLEAELVRDTVLASAGLLSRKFGGASVFPPQLPSITSEGTFGTLVWNVSPGEDRYRRSLYTFSKRTAPFAMFTAFDAPSGESCVSRRESSDTPLQALTLLNDAMFVEAAQALGKAYAAARGSDAERATGLFRRALTRPPQAEEVAMLVRFIEIQRRRFPGDEPTVWTGLARSIINLDEMIVKQ